MVDVRAVERDQQFLMPPSLSDWLSEDHLAWFVVYLVAELGLAELYTSLRADGRGGASYRVRREAVRKLAMSLNGWPAVL